MVQFTKLRLSGFKSFVDATELDIGPGLTGIVGPNGCGKSNLVEALRWAMGENSPKRMRSKGMNDVIFNGTEKRPQRNTAEVTILLNNEDRTAPAELNDADELEVSRKIERDVGSTYKVNGKNVRMRDVQLLFADSSIGAHSPALVSQGRVADMINAKPTQRRMVLEEAAGISGLHARRHEAELKLRAAENNLTRVEDVLGAMDNQLQSLQKQARQATRYRNLNGNIETTEGELLYLKWMNSQTAVQSAMKAFDDAENIVREKMLVVTNLSTQQTEAAALLPNLRQLESEAAAALQRLKLAYGSLESEERQVQEERTKSENLLAQYKTDIGHETLQKEEANTTIERLNVEKDTLNQETTNQASLEQEALDKKETAQIAVNETENKVSTLTENVAAQDAKRTSILRQIESLEQRLENLSQRKTRWVQEREDILANTPAKGQMDELVIEITTAEKAYTEASNAFDAAETARAEIETIVQSTTEKLQVVQKEYSELVAEADALRRILKNQQEGFEPVIDVLQVESGLEKALAVALGDDLQAALDGNAPIYWKDLPALSNAPALPGNAKPLSQFVTGPSALSRILSQIGVVENAHDAQNLMAQLQPGQCLVSADGGAWRWDGLVVSTNAENSEAIRLEQKNRLSELDIKIESVKTTLENARQESDTAKEKRAFAIETLNAARSTFRTAEENLNTLRRRHTSLSDQLTEVTAKLSSLSTSIENAVADIDALTPELAEAKEIQNTLPNTDALRTELTELKTTLNEQRSVFADAGAAYAEIRRAAESRARRLAQIDNDVQEWKTRIERIDQRLIDFQERITDAEQTLEELAERPGQIEQEKQNLLSHISEAETKRQNAADALQTAENTANDLQVELRRVESDLSDTREARAMAQANVNTTQHTQTGIEETIFEKFNVTPEQLVSKFDLNVEKLDDLDKLQSKLERLLRERENMGPVNLRAEVETEEITEQMSAMQAERDDLVQAIDKLREGINKLNKEARERLLNAFDTVNGYFQKLFTRLFNGGSAYLKLVEADDPLESGLEIYAQPPGKKLSILSLLSGGEQTLTSIALIFAMFMTNPAPICVLDEVDAPLDESNVDRYCTLLEDLSKATSTRFIVISHHRMTMARMDRLYGVTMSERGVSQLVSVDLKQHSFDLDQQAA